MTAVRPSRENSEKMVVVWAFGSAGLERRLRESREVEGEKGQQGGTISLSKFALKILTRHQHRCFRLEELDLG